MKITKNGIDANDYYALLDWKDKNIFEFQKLYPKRALNSLAVKELKELIKYIEEK